jgi:hypothetical protein
MELSPLHLRTHSTSAGLESRNPGIGEAKQAMAKHVFCMRSTASLKLDEKSAITSVQSGASIDQEGELLTMLLHMGKQHQQGITPKGFLQARGQVLQSVGSP